MRKNKDKKLISLFIYVKIIISLLIVKEYSSNGKLQPGMYEKG